MDKTQRAFFNSITKWKHDTAEIARQLVTSVALVCCDHLPVMHVLSGEIIPITGVCMLQCVAVCCSVLQSVIDTKSAVINTKWATPCASPLFPFSFAAAVLPSVSFPFVFACSNRSSMLCMINQTVVLQVNRIPSLSCQEGLVSVPTPQPCVHKWLHYYGTVELPNVYA